jgi:HAD superfamily hydrolase (TIGR01490 family)
MGTVAFCDIEGTLVAGSLTHSFVSTGRQMRFFAPARLAVAQSYALLSVVAPRRYRAGLRWRALLHLLAGQRRADVERVGRAGMPKLRAQFKPAVLARLAAHKRDGDTVILLSGGLHEAARLIAEAVGADAGEGTQAEVRAGRYTGRVGQAINHGPAKARRAAGLAWARGVALADCVAYGDSRADIPLLAAVGHPVAVDPDPALRAAAVQRGWEILRTDGGR